MIHQGCFERGVSKLVHAEGTQQRVLANAFDQIHPANEQTTLGASEQLVSASGDQIRAKTKAVEQSRLRPHSEIVEREEQARALVIEQGNILASGEGDQFIKTRPRGEPIDAEVRLVNAKDETGLWRNRALVVSESGTIRGAHLAHAGARLSENFGDAKAATDFD